MKFKLGGVALAAMLIAIPAIAQNAKAPAAKAPAAGTKSQAPQMTAGQLAIVNATVSKADKFVTAIGARNYDEAMQLTASQFRQSLGNQKLADVLNGILDARGATQQRVSVGVEELTPPAEAKLPVGKYVRVRYQTQFQKWGPSVEDVILFLETPDSWRVSHYFARPMPAQKPAAGGK